MREGAYRALQVAVDVMGGAGELAERIGAGRSDTYLRVMRKDDPKGAQMRAFWDYFGPLLEHDETAVPLINALCDLIGRKHPEPIVRVTDADIGRAWREMINRLPPGAREGARQDIAAALGVRPEEIG